MGVINFDMEVTTTIPPSRIFNAILDDNLIPKILPHALQCVEIIEGDGGPGSIKLITFGAEGPVKSVKHKVEVVDKENYIYCYSIVEGDVLMGKFEKIVYESKFVASPDGGSICKNNSKYYTIGDFELKEEQIQGSKERSLGLFKAVEAYLIANPDTYT